ETPARRVACARFRKERPLSRWNDERGASGRIRGADQGADRKVSRPLLQRISTAPDALRIRRNRRAPPCPYELLVVGGKLPCPTTGRVALGPLASLAIHRRRQMRPAPA